MSESSEQDRVAVQLPEPPRAESSKDKLAIYYDQHAVIQLMMVALGFVPGVGSLISSGASALATRAIQIELQRLEYLIKCVEAIATANRTRIDQEFIKTEACHDLMLITIEGAKKTRHRQRIDSLASILLGATTQELPPIMDPESILRTIPELSENEGKVLHFLWEQFGHRGEYAEMDWWSAPKYLSEKLGHEIEAQTTFILRRLIGYGFLTDYSYSTSSETGRSQSHHLIRFTATGCVLIQYLKDRGKTL